MKGIQTMANLSYAQQANILAEFIKNEIDRLDSLPKEEAKKEARQGLQRAGIIDENGEYTEPYVALEKYYV